VPIAHPELVDYDPAAWARIESEGLGGFTGITPLRSFRIASPTSSSGLPSPPSEPAEPVDPSAGPSSSPSGTTAPAVVAEASALAPEILFTQDMVARQKYIGRIREKDWYAADIAYSGPEARRWAGVGYMAQGGQEIDKMVRGLWDERGWECLWVSLAFCHGFICFCWEGRFGTMEQRLSAESGEVGTYGYGSDREAASKRAVNRMGRQGEATTRHLLEHPNML